MFGTEDSSFEVVGGLPGLVFSLVVTGGSLLIFGFSLFVLDNFFSDADVSFLTAGFFLPLSLLVSREFSPNDLYARKARPLTTGIEVMPPIAISNSLKAMLLLDAIQIYH